MKKGDIIVTQGTVDRRYPSVYPYGIPIGTRALGRAQRHRDVPHGDGDAVRALRLARRGRRTRLDQEAVNALNGLKAAVLLFVAAILQVSIFTQVHILGGVPDLVLVMLVAVALLRGAVPGAIGGFFAGLLVDTATLGQLGLTSLVLTIAGYWIGRYGETTGRDRAHAPFTSVAVITVLFSFGVLLVHFVLGERAPAGDVFRGLLPAIVLNLDSHRAGVRARAAAAAPARPGRLRDRGAAPWLAPPRRGRRAGRGRAQTARPSSSRTA